VSLLEPSPCHVCGAMIVKPHPRSECAWVLRESRDTYRDALALTEMDLAATQARCEVLRREKSVLRAQLAEAQAALVVAQAMAGQR
jgi:hypothetical protein